MRGEVVGANARKADFREKSKEMSQCVAFWGTVGYHPKHGSQGRPLSLMGLVVQVVPPLIRPRKAQEAGQVSEPVGHVQEDDS